MKCDATPERVSARVDGEIAPDEERELVEHLERCPACAEEAELLEEVAVETATLLRAREAEISQPASVAPRSRMAPAAAIAAAVLVALAVYMFVPKGEGGPGDEPTAASGGEAAAVEELDRSVTELSNEWDLLKRDLHDALRRVKERGVEVEIPAFISES